MTARRPDAGERASRPRVIAALCAWLALAPLLQVLSIAGLRVANVAPDRPWNYVAYGLAAPYVAWLVWHRHPRARFAAYVFLTHEALRGLHFHRWEAVVLAGLWILLLQLPAVRRWLPSIRPAEMRARWRRRLGPLERPPRAEASRASGSEVPPGKAPPSS